jgi:hypothetical protein
MSTRQSRWQIPVMTGHRLAATLGLAGWLAAGCASVEKGGTATPQAASPGASAEEGVAAAALPDPPRRPDLPLALIVMPPSGPFQEVRRSLTTELKRSFNVATFIVSPGVGSDALAAAIQKEAPRCVVLMNNSSVRLYRDYQHAQPPGSTPPAIIVMAAFLEDIRGELSRATGISYEVPGVTAFVSLRAIVKTPVARIGVVHAKYERRFIERQKVLAAREHVSLVTVEVSNEPTASEIEDALAKLERERGIDALWVLNDNRLLKNGAFLNEAWRPGVESLGVPVIVGAAPLLESQDRFGTFAILPDHDALGVQTANLILDVADDGWRVEDHPIELPLSTITVVDVATAKQRFGLRDMAMQRIDRALQ